MRLQIRLGEETDNMLFAVQMVPIDLFVCFPVTLLSDPSDSLQRDGEGCCGFKYRMKLAFPVSEVAWWN